mmetsp:Transcript_45645/g.140701  ORF Transcript_45645/g.140701 Transcript_45645/m.140701 type:complete len:283 (-) Transcript_45645:1490-2338(-)
MHKVVSSKAVCVLGNTRVGNRATNGISQSCGATVSRMPEAPRMLRPALRHATPSRETNPFIHSIFQLGLVLLSRPLSSSPLRGVDGAMLIRAGKVRARRVRGQRQRAAAGAAWLRGREAPGHEGSCGGVGVRRQCATLRRGGVGRRHGHERGVRDGRCRGLLCRRRGGARGLCRASCAARPAGFLCRLVRHPAPHSLGDFLCGRGARRATCPRRSFRWRDLSGRGTVALVVGAPRAVQQRGLSVAVAAAGRGRGRAPALAVGGGYERVVVVRHPLHVCRHGA